ncbi:MAG: ribosome small subunit-dependent GTPase A [Flavobacteriaceae bacterium]|nr:ribosome small subunit-dependent GTPase A [Flavobacteriaceae bacterium]
MNGVVIKSTGSWYIVRTDNAAIVECRIRGKFRIKGIKSTNPVTVGDKVTFELEENSKNGVITKISERKNYIIRKSVNLSKQTHIIAANIDQVFLMITLEEPPTSTAFIDRFLATAEAYHIPVVLLLNKSDLESELLSNKRTVIIEAYTKIGYKCLEISVETQLNIAPLKQLMTGKVSMFSGHSGVGKSSLINLLAPHLQLATKNISEQHKQGLHTTTFAEMFELPFGGSIIDTPGIKGFGVVDMNPQEVDGYFPEFFELKSKCKFNNCLHVNEPDCAIKKAVEIGEITDWRYQNYLQIILDDETTYRTDIYTT